MNVIIGIGILALVGWLAISILPVILPVIGYALVGLIALVVFGAVFGKK